MHALARAHRPTCRAFFASAVAGPLVGTFLAQRGLAVQPAHGLCMDRRQAHALAVTVPHNAMQGVADEGAGDNVDSCRDRAAACIALAASAASTYELRKRARGAAAHAGRCSTLETLRQLSSQRRQLLIGPRAALHAASDAIAGWALAGGTACAVPPAGTQAEDAGSDAACRTRRLALDARLRAGGAHARAAHWAAVSATVHDRCLTMAAAAAVRPVAADKLTAAEMIKMRRNKRW